MSGHPYPCPAPAPGADQCAATLHGNEPCHFGHGNVESCDLAMRRLHPCAKSERPDGLCGYGTACEFWDGNNPGRCPTTCPGYEVPA